MFQDDLKKFRQLPNDIRQIFSSQGTLEIIKKIEKKYQIKLASLMIKLAINDISLDKLEDVLQRKYGLNKEQTNQIARELEEKVLVSVSNDFREDQQEIEKIKSKMPQVLGPVGYEQAADQILGELKFFSQDKVLESRFRNIILSRLRGVRDVVATREILMKPKKIGGMELNDGQAEKMIGVLDPEARRLQQKALELETEPIRREIEMPAELAKLVPKRREYIKTAIKLEPERELPWPKKSGLDLTRELEAPAEILKLQKETASSLAEPFINNTRPQPSRLSLEGISKPRKEGQQRTALSSLVSGAKPIAVPAKPKIPLPPVPTSTGYKPDVLKPKIEDIKPIEVVKPSIDISRRASKLIGPIDEIRELTLEDFRRTADPEEASARVKEKIDLLEKESFEKKDQAIKAWRASEIYQLYLDIGQESMLDEKTIEQVLSERQAAGKKTLSQAEFEAVTDLNQELRF